MGLQLVKLYLTVVGMVCSLIGILWVVLIVVAWTRDSEPAGAAMMGVAGVASALVSWPMLVIGGIHLGASAIIEAVQVSGRRIEKAIARGHAAASTLVFDVTGVDVETNLETRLAVSAQSREQAQKIAEARGVRVLSLMQQVPARR